MITSFCRQAQCEEDNSIAVGLDHIENTSQPNASDSNASQVIVDNDGDDGAWSFDSSISIEEGSHENGQVHCLVNKEILDTGLVSCLNAVEGICNAAIMACINPFEEHCKKVIKMEDKKV